MRLCLLVDGLGVGHDLHTAALETWASASADAVGAAWLVRDSGDAAGASWDHPGFAFAEGRSLWVHQPLIPRLQDDSLSRQQRFRELSSSWSPPLQWQDNQSMVVESIAWHVSRRWRMLTAPAVLERLRRVESDAGGCGWFGFSSGWVGYFRANAFVDVEATLAVLEHEVERQGGSQKPLIFGRSIAAQTQGVTMPVLEWGGSILAAAWISSGLMLNRAAMELMAATIPQQPQGGTVGAKSVDFIIDFLIGAEDGLAEALSGQRNGDSPQQGTVELAFAASLRSQDRHLKLLELPNQEYRFLVKGQLLERFAFRLGAATFGWSAQYRKLAGLPVKQGSSHRKPRRLGRQSRFWSSCTGVASTGGDEINRCSGISAGVLLPQCVLSFYPVGTAALMRALQQVAPSTTCLPAFGLKQAAGVRVV
ncbi:unnamed protein product, partial [Polarella glacialis]